MRGRKPQPTALRVLRGNPGKRSLPKNEPKPDVFARVPAAPSHLSRMAATEWRRMAKQLVELSILTSADLKALECYCDAYAKMRTASLVLDKHGLTYETRTPTGSIMQRKRPECEVYSAMLTQVRAFATEFGLTPSSRSRVQTTKPATDERESDDEFMSRRSRG